MGLPLPKTPLIALVSQVLALAFGIICLIPGQNGILEGAYILSVSDESESSRSVDLLTNLDQHVQVWPQCPRIQQLVLPEQLQPYVRGDDQHAPGLWAYRNSTSNQRLERGNHEATGDQHE